MTEPDSTRSPASGAFPDTRFSVVHATGSDDAIIRQQAWATLIRSYWKPAYKYIRIKWRSSEEDAQDLTQEFFTRALDAGFFRRFDPARARFRTYLRVCLHGFLANELKAATRKKRGGDYQMLSLDFDAAERELARSSVAPDVDAEEFFRQESIRSLFADTIAELREHMTASGRDVHFAIFERYDLASPGEGERPTYQMLAGEFGLPVTQITNFLALVRRQFRRILLDRLRAISGSESEYRLEAMELLGVDPDDVAL